MRMKNVQVLLVLATVIKLLEASDVCITEACALPDLGVWIFGRSDRFFARIHCEAVTTVMHDRPIVVRCGQVVNVDALRPLCEVSFSSCKNAKHIYDWIFCVLRP